MGWAWSGVTGGSGGDPESLGVVVGWSCLSCASGGQGGGGLVSPGVCGGVV